MVVHDTFLRNVNRVSQTLSNKVIYNTTGYWKSFGIIFHMASGINFRGTEQYKEKLPCLYIYI